MKNLMRIQLKKIIEMINGTGEDERRLKHQENLQKMYENMKSI